MDKLPVDVSTSTVDSITSQWQQGDLTLESKVFFYLVLQTSAENQDPSDEESSLYNNEIPQKRADYGSIDDDTRVDRSVNIDQEVNSEIKGLVVVTQTCDVVRSCESREYVEVCPLVEVDKQTLKEIKAAKRPNYAYLPGVESLLLVADLDRVMTVKKQVLTLWDRNRIRGCKDEKSLRSFSEALARKRNRFAFPDDLNYFLKGLTSVMQAKAGKNSDLGQAIEKLYQIRVCASPSWDAEKIKLTIYFVADSESSIEELLPYYVQWRELIKTNNKYIATTTLVSLDRMTAREFEASIKLDLDNLSRNS